MRINEILTESQLQQLDEGPILNKIGSVVGGAARGLAKGIGAVAGGVVGAGKALKKGYQTGKAIVGDDPDPNKGQPGYDGSAPAAGDAPTAGRAAPAAAPAAGGTAPAAAPAAGGTAPAASTTPPSAQDINAQGPTGTAPAKAQTGQAGAALAKTDAVTDKQTATKAGETVYAQVKANIDKLDKKGKQRILQLLQKSVAAPAPKPAAPKAPAGGAPTAADPAGGAPTAADPAAAATDPGAAAFGNMAKTLSQEPTKAAPSKPAAAPTAADPAAPTAADPAAAAGGKLTPAQQAAKVAELKGKRAAGKTTGTTGSGFKQYTKDASSQRIVGANKDGSPKIQQIKASKINYGNALSEALAQRVEMHKQKMFETGLARGTVSVFRK